MENVKEFVAYSKKLLRVLRKIRQLLDGDSSEIEQAKILIDELIEDTQGDVEA